ncbi:MAG: hypothetical protein QME81_19885 [bacterium]|nr:hypothetical protein [bacterium]
MATTLRLEREVRGLRELLTTNLLPQIERVLEKKSILIYTLHSSSLKLKDPLAVHLEYDQEEVIASCYDLDLFGYGETEVEALEDIRATIEDLYYELKENESKLGILPQRIWGYLSSVIEEKKGLEG